jgi:site-specific recombinase XerD
MLVIHRRHIESCPHTSRDSRKCKCPIWCDWKIGGKRLQKPLGTAEWSVAQLRARDMEAVGPDLSTAPVTIHEATKKFLTDAEISRGLREPTLRKYKLLFRRLNEFFDDRGYILLSQITADDLREFRQGWKLSPRTAGKNIERMKTFFRFAYDFEWTRKNPAIALKSPKAEETDAKPFTEDEVGKILDACTKFDGNRARVKALVLLLLNTGLRIGDAVVITRDKFVKDKTGWKIELRTTKTKTEVLPSAA